MIIKEQLKQVYCSYNFLKNFCSGNPEPFLISRLQEFLFDPRINLFYDFKESETDEVWSDRDGTEPPSSLSSLYSRIKGKHNRFEYNSLDDFIKASNFNTIILCDNNDDYCKSLSNQYGIIVVNHKMADDSFFDRMLNIQGDYITKCPQYCSWDKILPKSITNCNSLIIIDNYIFKSIDNDLIPILEKIIPKTLNDCLCIFHIAIFCNMKKYDDTKLSDKKNIENRQNIIDEVKKKIEEKYPDKVSFTIYDTDKFHDRYIITNNYFLMSGAGFTLFQKNKNEVDNNTTLLYYHPLTTEYDGENKWPGKTVKNTIINLSEIAQKADNNKDRFPQFYSRENIKESHRLIDPIYQEAIIDIINPISCKITINDEQPPIDLDYKEHKSLFNKINRFSKGDKIEVGRKFGAIIDIRPKNQNLNI